MSDENGLKGFALDPAPQPDASEPVPSNAPGRIYTFYSFKGGVGRSMALANIAVLAAAQGKKVLIVDFDLEAPGLDHFFHQHDPHLAGRLEQTPGVIDLLGPEPIDWKSARTRIEIDSTELDALSYGAEPGWAEGHGSLDIIHSGRAHHGTDAYTERVQQLNWTELYEKHDIGTRFGRLRAEWIAEYDLVFVDSRTGVTDIGDLCTVVLPDHLVLLFVTNQQNIEGIAEVYRRAVEEHRKMPFDRARLTALPVLSRDEFYSEAKLSREWRQKAADALAPLFQDWLPENLRPIDAFQKIFIPYFAIWSFGEALPVLNEPEAVSNPSSINAAYSRICRLIVSNLDWSSLDRIADPAEISATRTVLQRELAEEQQRYQDQVDEQLRAQRDQLDAERARLQTARRRASVSRFAGALGLFTILTGLIFFAYSYFQQISVREDLARLQERYDARESELAEVQSALAEAEETLETAVPADTVEQLIDDATRQTRRQYEDRLAALEEELKAGSAAQGSTEELRAQVAELRSELEAQRERVTTLTSERDRCDSDLTRAEAVVTDVTDQLQDFRAAAAATIRANPVCAEDILPLLRK